ncbi:hypothetical protein N7G274_005666 [Stereocaulon virgatum]|uniref:Uncharacterized protein n=1 Tax=Stereocaulon virgatum TaxID=373712 RepID=A0ABR4A968_9LECA
MTERRILDRAGCSCSPSLDDWAVDADGLFFLISLPAPCFLLSAALAPLLPSLRALSLTHAMDASAMTRRRMKPKMVRRFLQLLLNNYCWRQPGSPHAEIRLTWSRLDVFGGNSSERQTFSAADLNVEHLPCWASTTGRH